MLCRFAAQLLCSSITDTTSRRWTVATGLIQVRRGVLLPKCRLSSDSQSADHLQRARVICTCECASLAWLHPHGRVAMYHAEPQVANSCACTIWATKLAMPQEYAADPGNACLICFSIVGHTLKSGTSGIMRSRSCACVSQPGMVRARLY